MDINFIDVFVGCGLSIIAFVLLKLWSMDNEIKEIKTDVKWLIDFHKEKDTNRGSLFG